MNDFEWFGKVAGLPHSGQEAHLILEIMHAYKALINAFSREVGMPMSQLALLRALAGAPKGGIGVLDISRSMGINAAAVTRLVKKMEERGLIIRRHDRHDGRRSYLRLSAKGRGLFMEIHQRFHRLEDSLCAGQGPEDIETAKQVLARLRADLERTYHGGAL